MMDTDKPKTEMSAVELQQKEDYDFRSGPFSVLHNAVKNNNTVLISCRNNKKLLGRVLAFDRHMNMVLVNVCELWTESTSVDGQKTQTTKDRYIPKLFLRGDSVVLVVRNQGT